MSKTALAILVSDIHLSDKPPIFRSSEPDWFEAMKRPLDQLQMSLISGTHLRS
jgi:hypothetical protein